LVNGGIITDVFHINLIPTLYKYLSNKLAILGVTLQTNGRSFTKHLKDKTAAAIIAMNEIKVIHQLSLETAIALFHIKI
jgi:hypothetical protein